MKNTKKTKTKSIRELYKANEKLLAKEYRPLSSWSYFGRIVLYAIPIIGWIFLLIHAIKGKNRHGRSFARSYFCALLVIAVVGVIAFALTTITPKTPEESTPEVTTFEETTPEESSPEETTPEEVTTPEETTPEVTTPEETTTVEDPWFVTPPYEGNGITDENVLERAYIITGDSESEVFAGQELAAYLTKKNVEIAEGGFPIILFVDPTLENDAFLIDTTLRGEEASMTIRGGNGRGVLYGVYRFLEKYAGVRYFTATLETIPEGNIVLCDGNMLAYEPYFEYRHTSWHCSFQDSLWSVKVGINGNGNLTPDIGGKISYGPGLFVHSLGWLSETGDALSPNPCLSSEETYQTVLKNLRKVLEENPDTNIVSVSQNDKNIYCECESCIASYAYYTNKASDYEKGGTAGNLLAFINRLAEELEKDYPDLVIDTLAYNYTQAPPKNIVPRHNVCIRVCSIRACFMHPMIECPDAKGPNNIQWTRTAQFRQDFLAWGEICDRIYVWDYTTNYTYYIAPFSNFGSLRENMRMYHENGVCGMYAQGNHQSISGEFGELRAYLIAQLMWDPYMSEEEYYAHMDEFLQAYYGEGWQGIREYIDKTTELAQDGCINIYEAPLQSITKQEYLDNEADFDEWWNTAEELAGDRLEYVQRSRLQWRYIQLLLHPDRDACEQFVEEVEALGIRWAEGNNNNKPLDEMFPDLYPENIDENNVLKRACIITGESENEEYAGQEMAYYLTQKNVEIADDGFPIILFLDPTLEADAFLVDVTIDGKEASMTIRGGGGSGLLYGVYKFLEQYAGVRYFTPTLEKIPEGDIVLSEGNMLAYTPTFEYRHSNWYGSEDEEAASWNVKNGMNGSGSITDEMGGKWNYGPMFVHTIGPLSGTGYSNSPNPCLSDPNILRKVIQNVRNILADDPSINIVSISQNDNGEYCTCEACAAVDKEEGSPAGLLLRFVNAVAEDLEKDYPNLVIDTLAYNYTQKAPLKTVPRHNVCVRVCPIRCCFSHPVTECKIEHSASDGTQTMSASFMVDFAEWSKICDRIYIWDYTTNFRYYVPTFPNFGVLRENMRYYADHSVRGMFSQGNYQSVCGEFAELRIYLIAKLMWDPYMGEEEYYAHMDEFLEAYYGAGWEYIRKYIDKTTELAEKNCMGIYTHPFDIISKEDYLANADDFITWWATAEELAGDCLENVKRSRLQWRYIQLMLYPNASFAELLYREIVYYYDMRFAESWQYNDAPDEWYAEAS